MIQFILGMIFTCFCYPAFELLISYLQQMCQFKCTQIAAKTYEIKKRISDEKQEPLIERVPAIGFKMPDDPEYYQDDDQEEQDD